MTNLPTMISIVRLAWHVLSLTVPSDSFCVVLFPSSSFVLCKLAEPFAMSPLLQVYQSKFNLVTITIVGMKLHLFPTLSGDMR